MDEDKVDSLNDFRDEKDDENIEVDEDKVDSLNDSRDENDDENIDDKIEGCREDFNDNYGDLEEDQEPGKDMKPEPPPQPPLYRPSRPPIKHSFLGTTSFQRRTGVHGVIWFEYNRSVFRRISISSSDLWTNGKILEHTVRDLRKILELKNRFYY